MTSERLMGYISQQEKLPLDIDLLQPVSYEDGWNELVLPEGHRKMVQAMVETFAAASSLNTGLHTEEQPQPNLDKVGFDPVKQKGDIGYNPDEVESRLEKHFHLAQRWGCVMLLDEADVFLAKRTKEDMQRNALVSVFLRVLEYYKGILFLTTNRVGAFDEAFHSRIHLSLYYPTLNREKTLEIFKTHFRRIKKHNEERVQKGDAPIESEKKRLQKFWKRHYKVLKWNGRQIRNAFQTAMALAEYDARDSGEPPIITVKHFKTIAHASAEFAKYVTEIHGAEADQLALRDKNRLDRNPEASSKLRKLQNSSSSDSADSGDSGSGNSSGEDSDDVDDKKKRNKSKKQEKTKGGRNDKKERKDTKGKKVSSSGKGDGRGCENSSSEEDN
ncbi:hypothetical protein VSDG_01791 [Cytospora chrysosperma]|uniref:Uncharacterized protein n=1 Tax=Cytospora chrysosperma TaxID=252740 RepID=A0A423WI39_CYTCH|nr:hypothetical protein VSDG_01791 [Valsa sordida]